MNKDQQLSLLFLFLGVVFVIGGMAAKNVFEYSPILGWILGLIAFLTSTYFASKAKK
ncbi:hypothetical protein [Paenibacillus paridis]|jgi:uncharacterized membrane protein YhaH (DUF805 family)|uniref:hypothetical protein n=1 Tax=Paenibacillus paridis TaxID=2583376 RepID=UPI00192E50A6|nr:hypothetical protein [Paenibacillus paridis]